MFRKKYKFVDFIFMFYQLNPMISVIKTFYYLIYFTIPFLRIKATAYFVDTAIEIVQENGLRPERIFLPIVFILLMMIYDIVGKSIMGMLMKYAKKDTELAVIPNLTEHMVSLKYRYFENKESMDVISRVTDKFVDMIIAVNDTLFELLYCLFSIVGFVIVLGEQYWWLAILFVGLSFPTYMMGYRFAEKTYQVDKSLAGTDRKNEYYYEVLTGRDSVNERYLFGYEKMISSYYKEGYEFARRQRKKIERRKYIRMRSISDIISLSSILIVGTLISGTISGKISLGVFASLSLTIFPLGEMLSWRLPVQTSSMKLFSEFLNDVNTFFSYEVNRGATEAVARTKIQLNSIEFEHVSFKYPGTYKYVLNNISFKFYAGQHYAIVGANGEGKSTIIKLLTGLYDNYEGNIYINDQELRDYESAERKALIAVLYQDFARFPLTFYENVAIGNAVDMDNSAAVKNACDNFELQDVVDKLPKGINTSLTKAKNGGVDLSGGEWQRLALARLFINEAPIKILDEPTAALDPIAESRMYEHFQRISDRNKSNIIIFISHRLGSVKLADKILVIGGGTISEQGDFRTLMNKNGIFANMYRAQSDWYKSEDEKEN